MINQAIAQKSAFFDGWSIKKWLVYWCSITPILLLIAWFSLNKLYPLPPYVLEHSKITYSQRVVDHHGDPLRYFPTEQGYWRFPVDVEQIAPIFLDMQIRFEDKRFYHHFGVDGVALLRAIGQRLWHGELVSGGSTISMQVARLLEPKSRTIKNKLFEMFRATQLEWYQTKSEILALYLTFAPYGGNIQGIEAASEFYFGKSAAQLLPSEAALLVSLPQNPERLRPDRYPEAAKARRDINLTRLHKQGVLDDQTYQLALQSKIPQGRRNAPQIAMHLSERLVQTAINRSDTMRASVDHQIQKQAEALAKRVQQQLPDRSTVALLAVDRRTMRSVAYVGSGDFFASARAGQVDVVTAIRSPGSTLKPLIYGLAFNQGWLHPKTVINDQAEAFAGYQPRNFDDQYAGEMSVIEALISSRNLPAIKVLDRLEPLTLTQALDQHAITYALPNRSDESAEPGLPIAVGGIGMSLESLVTLYGCLANLGICQPVQHTLLEAPFIETKEQAHSRLLSARSAWFINQILLQMSRPIADGRDKQDALIDHPIAFKTGTSYGYRDAWAVGYDQDWLVGVWLGRPDGAYQQQTTGLDDAAPIMLDIFALLDQSTYRSRYAQDGLSTKWRINQEYGQGQMIIPISPFAYQHEQDRRSYQGHDIPSGLQQFDPVPWAVESANHAAGPEIFYPPEQSELMLADGSAPLPMRSVRLRYSTSKYPLIILLNGRLYQRVERGYPSDEVLITPEREGAYEISIIDPEGRSDQVHFWVNRSAGG